MIAIRLPPSRLAIASTARSKHGADMKSPEPGPRACTHTERRDRTPTTGTTRRTPNGMAVLVKSCSAASARRPGSGHGEGCEPVVGRRGSEASARDRERGNGTGAFSEPKVPWGSGERVGEVTDALIAILDVDGELQHAGRCRWLLAGVDMRVCGETQRGAAPVIQRRAGRMRSPAMPPSTASAVPVVALAAGDARWRMAAATSSAVTSRPIG